MLFGILGLFGMAFAGAAPAPRCVVPLTPALAEMVAELDPAHPDRICGVTEYSDRPAFLAQKPSVGRYDRLVLESVVSLKPDLLLASRQDNSEAQIRKLVQMGIPVLLTSTPDLNAIPETLMQVGKALHQEEAAVRAARALQAAFTGFQKRHAADQRRPRVFLQLGDAPLIGVGQGSFLHQALQWVGGQNLLADQTAAYPRISRELVLQRKPDLILILALGQSNSEFVKMRERWLEAGFTQTEILRADALMRPNATVLEGLFLLEKALKGGTP